MADLSKEYTAALFSLAMENGLVDEFKQELGEIKDLIDDDYILVLSSPALSLSMRLDMIDEAFGTMHEYVVSFMKLLCENGQISILPEAINEFFLLCHELENRVTAKIYYVKEPSEAQKARLEDKLSKMTGKKIDALYIEDSALIGGIKIELDDRIIDGSLSARLSNIKGVIGK
ncbi:MAG: ATP synthase F1 subunit delta [Clostridia bacterium]|nr:ATP synthase F1 subunit delta [Clostridia bacterium]